MQHVPSYSKVYQLGHKSIADLLKDSVTVEEKVDGSQFSFGIINGELACRSHNKDMFLDAPEKMFNKAVETIKSIAINLHFDWVYRCEYLEKPKHNVLAYDRVPDKHLILYDVMTAPETYLSCYEKKAEAEHIGLECVPVVFEGIVTDFDMFEKLLERTSILGGSLIEGVVIKNYNLMTAEKKVAMGKYVSSKFKETAKGDWKARNPSAKDYVETLASYLRTPARWDKAIIHMKEDGSYTGSPADIGPLIKAIPEDILEEAGDDIKERLFAHFWPILRREVVRGFPEYYKEQLAKLAFPDTMGDTKIEE